MIDMIVNSTNNKLSHYSQDKTYMIKTHIQPVDPIEIRGYFGLLLLFGVLKKSNVGIQDIWSEKGIHHSYHATATMPRNRFKVISCCLSFDEIETRESRKLEDPKFYKIRSCFEEWRRNIRNAYEPGLDLCVDETLNNFKYFFKL
jgi:hypothetical protein